MSVGVRGVRATRWIWGALAATSFGLVADGAAQPAPQRPASGPPAIMDSTFEGLPSLTPREMQQLAHTRVSDIQGMLTNLVQQMRLAQAQKDIVKLNCLRSYHAKLMDVSKSAEERARALGDSLDRNVMPEATARYGEVLMLFRRAESLRGEASSCLGASDEVATRVTIEVEEPGGGGGPDPTEAPKTIREVQRPQRSSPYR